MFGAAVACTDLFKQRFVHLLVPKQTIKYPRLHSYVSHVYVLQMICKQLSHVSIPTVDLLPTVHVYRVGLCIRDHASIMVGRVLTWCMGKSVPVGR